MKKVVFFLVCICVSTVLYGQWTTNVNDIYYSSGLVGIGTSSPSHTLQVTSSNNPTVSIGKLNTNTGGKSTLYFYAGNGSTSNGMALSYFKNSSADRVSFIDGSLSEVFTIRNGGNVGIGTTSPNFKLQVGAGDINIDNGQSYRIGGAGLLSRSSNQIQFGSGDPADLIKFTSGGAERMRIDLNGNVGIGTTPNLVQLDIQQNTVYGIGLKTANRSFTMRVDGTSFILGDRSVHQDRLTVLGNGYVGIGVTSPSFKLHVAGDMNLDDGKSYRIAGESLLYRSSNLIQIGSNNAADYLRFVSGGNERMRIDAAGNMGIGTHAPTQKLHVNGSSRFDSWIAGNSSTGVLEIYGDQESSSGLVIRDSGNVGIGTTTPGNKLEVNGTIRSKKVKVETSGWPDFVFAPEYGLKTLEEVESFINKNQHLPEVPSAKEVEKYGLDLGDMDVTLLKKVEELTLYMIELNKTVKAQGEKIKALEKENEELKKKK